MHLAILSHTFQWETIIVMLDTVQHDDCINSSAKQQCLFVVKLLIDVIKFSIGCSFLAS